MSLLVVSCALFAAGLYVVLSRRDLVAVLAGVEVMIGGPLVLLAGLGGARGAESAGIGAIVLLLVVAVAAEAAVGFALLVTVARRTHTTRVDELTEVKG